jgi:hypothetical protein
MTNLQPPKRGRPTTGLTPRQAATLELLYRYRNGYGTPYQQGEPERGWFRPMDLGGAAGTNHSHWLRNLVGRGLVDSKSYSPAGRGTQTYSRIYRISGEGIAVWEGHVGAG